MSITTVLEFRVKAADVAGTPAALRSILVDTRNFDGCLGVDVIVDTADEAHFFLIERWESVEADDAYRAWRATPEGAPTILGAILAAAPVTTVGTLLSDI